MKRSYTSVADLLADESFVRYCLHASREDRETWESYISAHPGQKALIDEAAGLLYLMHESLAADDLEKQLARLKVMIAPDKEIDDAGLYPEKKAAAGNRILRFAAAAAVAVVIIGGYWLLQRKQAREPVPEAVASYQTYTCRPGDRKTIVLPDSTRVILNSNSTLKVPDHFNKQNRKVLLEGAAFFDVAHDPGKPLTVLAGNLATVDIGTSFLVRAYSNEESIRVMLLTGKVKVETNRTGAKNTSHNRIELSPGERVTVNRENGQLRTGTYDIAALKNWIAGRLAFQNASFEKVVEELQQWYGIQIEVTGKHHKKRHFTGQFDHEKLDNVLKVVSFSMECRYEMEGDKVIFRF